MCHHMQFCFYRLVIGMAFLYLYFTGVSQNYAGLHGGMCDVITALTAIPLSQYIKTHGLAESRGLVITCWSFYGLVVDFCTTFVLFSLNVLGYFQPQYSLAIFLQNPISMIMMMFNVPLASVIQVLIITRFDDMIEMGSVSSKFSPGYQSL